MSPFLSQPFWIQVNAKTGVLMSQYVFSIRDHCVYAYHRLKESTLQGSSPSHDIRIVSQGSRDLKQVMIWPGLPLVPSNDCTIGPPGSTEVAPFVYDW